MNGKIKTYRCEKCYKIFSNFRSLGGHFSNNHAGESDIFNHKKDVREKRTIEREAFKIAKNIYINEYGT
jgi:hypothetical protein